MLTQSVTELIILLIGSGKRGSTPRSVHKLKGRQFIRYPKGLAVFLPVFIKESRVNQGLTREKFANMANISDKFLYDIEVGNKGMSAESLYKIAIALGVSTDWLLTGD